jgi:starch phosphorylase
VRAIRRFTVRPVLPEPLRLLGDLATNLRWSWHPETQDVFKAMDPEIWRQSGHDPVKTLGAVPSARLAELANDKKFVRRLELAHADLEQYLAGDRWFQRKAGDDAPRAIAYFSPEFGITSVLPQYSGGLGILAGDHLKTASDLGIPLIGVGLLYQHGYFRQQFSREGWQQETYPVLDPDGLPITLLREADGSPAVVRLAVPGDADMVARIFVAEVGRVPLLLLDTDVEDNPATLREVTDRLYGGTTEHRPSRSCCSASVASGRSGRSPGSRVTPSPRCFTPTRATPASSASSGSVSSPCPRTGPASTSRPRSR